MASDRKSPTINYSGPARRVLRRLQYLGVEIGHETLTTYIKDEMDALFDAVYCKGRADERADIKDRLSTEIELAFTLVKSKMSSSMSKPSPISPQAWSYLRQHSK
jgi:hypothetical protein